jgi:hypothetical protein
MDENFKRLPRKRASKIGSIFFNLLTFIVLLAILGVGAARLRSLPIPLLQFQPKRRSHRRSLCNPETPFKFPTSPMTMLATGWALAARCLTWRTNQSLV